jgi:hypothetical protein
MYHIFNILCHDTWKAKPGRRPLLGSGLGKHVALNTYIFLATYFGHKGQPKAFSISIYNYLQNLYTS